MEYQPPTEVIKRVGIYMSVAMPTNKNKLADHLVGLDACRYDLAKKTAEWHKLLADKKRQALHPKDKDLTELDRNVMLEANVSVIRADYEFLVRLEELAKERIELGMVLLTL
jgi:hypothetical protein